MICGMDVWIGHPCLHIGFLQPRQRFASSMMCIAIFISSLKLVYIYLYHIADWTNYYIRKENFYIVFFYYVSYKEQYLFY